MPRLIVKELNDIFPRANASACVWTGGCQRVARKWKMVPEDTFKPITGLRRFTAASELISCINEEQIDVFRGACRFRMQSHAPRCHRSWGWLAEGLRGSFCPVSVTYWTLGLWSTITLYLKPKINVLFQLIWRDICLSIYFKYLYYYIK